VPPIRWRHARLKEAGTIPLPSGNERGRLGKELHGPLHRRKQGGSVHGRRSGSLHLRVEMAVRMVVVRLLVSLVPLGGCIDFVVMAVMMTAMMVMGRRHRRHAESPRRGQPAAKTERVEQAVGKESDDEGFHQVQGYRAACRVSTRDTREGNGQEAGGGRQEAGRHSQCPRFPMGLTISAAFWNICPPSKLSTQVLPERSALPAVLQQQQVIPCQIEP